jgi:hypothetical protein
VCLPAVSPSATPDEAPVLAQRGAQRRSALDTPTGVGEDARR